ncbi:cytokine receptor [Anopheles stephensi]|uniref:cytokine receptor n=1 Tax=Anopheles stephensi TaxID=30069 RepID=UPI000EF63CD5|nr:cytokine receptor [Anopheles stephensi]
MNRAGVVTLICWICSLSQAAAIGWIYPYEAFYREVNESFSLKCTLDMRSSDTRGLNSSNLMFYRGDEPVPREQVKILNASTIEFTVDRAVPQTNYAYTCKVNDTKGVGMRSVYIGHKPREVKDFKCRAPLWEKHMECTFTPDPNTIGTEYTLMFHFFPLIQKYSCTLENVHNSNQKRCIIDGNSGYRNLNEYYYFVLTANNTFGTLSQKFKINQFDVVIAHAPLECTIENITSDSAVLKWKKWYRYDIFTFRSFICEIKLLSIFDNNVWRTVSIDGLKLNQRNYTLPLRHLPYAAAAYDVRIRMRVNSTEQGEDMWSNHTSCLFETLPRKPDMPPDVAVGGFENSNEHHLFVYWRELDNWQHNARSGFYYTITMRIGHDGRIIEHLNATTGMIDRHRVADMDYTFTIRSANAEGSSERSSTVFVPSRQNRLAKPIIDKLLSDSGKFTLSWKPPSSIRSAISSYTVFWCNTTSNSPNDCNGSINFTSVAPDQTTFVLNDAGSTLNFAVAANSGRLSSGMVWAACTATHKTDIGKLKTIWIAEMLSSYITLKWKTECGDVAHTGYIIYYCPISSPRTLGCKEPELTINVTDKNQHNCRLENLKPYVTYKIEIAMYSETHIGPRSEPLVNTTREAAPSPPRNLVVRKITNNSISLHWAPPEHINGGKMSYEINYNGHPLKYNVEEPEAEENQTLENLDAFTEYNITVRALTIGFSNASQPVRVRTLVGNPQTIAQPSTNSSNNSKLTITWNPPAKPSGCVEFYELRVKAKQTVTYQQRRTECQLREAICQNRDSSKYEFLVRAVNVDIGGPDEASFEELSCPDRWTELNRMWSDLKRYVAHAECGTYEAIAERSSDYSWLDSPPPNVRLHYGPWSEPLAHWCSMENKNAVQPFMLIGVIMMCSLLVLGYSYIRVKHVLQVKVIIPDGLNDITGSGKPGFNAVIGPTGIIFTEHHRVDPMLTGGSTKEASYTKEQNQCLLPSSSSSGGSIADLSGHDQRSSADYCSNSGCCEDDSTSFYDQEAERQDLHGYSDETTESIENSQAHDRHLGSTGSSRSNDIVEPSFGRMNQGNNTSSPIQQNRPSAMPLTVTSGYVPAPVVVSNIKQPINSNGYLQIGALTTNGGSMMAPMDTMQKAINAKMAAAAPISGYVTHKQLSDYGQHLK